MRCMKHSPSTVSALFYSDYVTQDRMKKSGERSLEELGALAEACGAEVRIVFYRPGQSLIVRLTSAREIS